MPGELTARDRAKLCKILGMLGSDAPGEQASAAMQAERLRRALKMTWDELLRPAAPALTAEPPPPDSPEALYADYIAFARRNASRLREKEASILSTLERWTGKPTGRQLSALIYMCSRLRREGAV